LSKLRNFPEKVVLGGGTACCLQLGHRKSYDFDIFLKKPLSPQFFHQVTRIFGMNLEKLVDTQDQLSILLENKVELTFLHYYYSPLFPVISTKFIPIYDLKDIALDKAYTLGRRGIWRDYVDLYFLLKEKHLTLKELLKLGKKKFRAGFAPKLFLEQLTYFGDIKDYTIEYIGREINHAEIKRFLRNEVKQFKQKILKPRVV
jgi:predicted nucleotidyltransferase component of viral defense system